MQENAHSITVLGAGVIGIACAVHLLRDGHRVTIIDRLPKRPPIVLFGSEFWDKVIDLNALANFGTIDEQDLDLFLRTDSVDEAFEFITTELAAMEMNDTESPH